MTDAAPIEASQKALSAQRRALLGEQPSLLGASWARGWRESVATEGRAVSGGWPGTLPEARARVLRHFDAELARRGMALLSHAELALATTATYDRAKRDWHAAARDARMKPKKSPT